jgi:hypothetical protein
MTRVRPADESFLCRRRAAEVLIHGVWIEVVEDDEVVTENLSRGRRSGAPRCGTYLGSTICPYKALHSFVVRD